VTDKVHGFGPGQCVREIALGEAVHFVVGGLDQSAASGPERNCSYTREAPVAGSMTALAKGFDLRSEIRGVKRSDDAACELAAGMRIGDVLVLRHIVGRCFFGGARFLRGGFGTVAATSSVTVAVLVCDCWWN
jgi:hypothetical protein